MHRRAAAGHAAQCHAQWLNAGIAQVGHDGSVGGTQHAAQGTADLGCQQLAGFGALRHRVDGTQHGVAHHLRPQRIALAVSMAGRAAWQQGRDIGVELPQFPVTTVSNVHAEAFGCDLGVDFAVLDQAHGVPRIELRRDRGRRAGQRAGIAHHAFVERVVEAQHEHRRLAVQFELRAQQAVALVGVASSQRRQAQAFDGALNGAAGRQLQVLNGRLQRCWQAVNGSGLHGSSGGRPVCGHVPW